MNPRFSLFLRAIGIKPGFRRTGPSSLVNIAFVSFVGVVSGRYIFGDLLEEHWQEQRRLQQEMEQSSSTTTTSQQGASNNDHAGSS
jgi:hypothetical protein